MKTVKRILISFVGLMVVSATIHVAIMILTVLIRGDIKYLNYFRILGLEEFFPKIGNGILSNLISLLIMILIFTFFWVKNLKKTN